MSYFGSKDFGLEVGKGNVDNHDKIQKFGFNVSISTTYVPICFGGDYPTPTSAETLNVFSTDANDTSGGTGAWSIAIEGVDGDFTSVRDIVVLNGTTTVQSSTAFMRVTRSYIHESGTYATQTSGSHAGDITVQATTGTYAMIGGSGVFPKGQSQIGVYTTPKDKEAYVTQIEVDVDVNKDVKMLFFQREGADVVTAPFKPMRLQQEYNGITESREKVFRYALGPFPPKTDFGFMARTSAGTAAAAINFEIIRVSVTAS